MRWTLCLIALLALAACDDDTTGPDRDASVSWVPVTLPPELTRGSVARLAAGADRVVGLFRGTGGEWVFEETPAGWEIVLGKAIPFLPRSSAAAARDILFTFGTGDVVVGDDGRVYVVGAAEVSGPFGELDRTPAIWAEVDTGWVLTTGPEGAGILLAAEWRDGVGIEAFGPGITSPTVVSVRGTPEAGLEWMSRPVATGDEDFIVTDVAHTSGLTFLTGSIWPDAGPPVTPLPISLVEREGVLEPLELPCMTCEGLTLAAVEPWSDGVYWAGALIEPGDAVTPTAYTGWLAAYDHSGRAAEIPLPPEIERVYDAMDVDGPLFLAVRTAGGGGIYRVRNQKFTPESVPERSFVHALLRTPDGRLFGAGSQGEFPVDDAPLILERQ